MITLDKWFVGYTGGGSQAMPCYRLEGHCLPEDVGSLPTGPSVYNGSEVTVIGAGTVLHYDADGGEWVDFVGGDA